MYLYSINILQSTSSSCFYFRLSHNQELRGTLETTLSAGNTREANQAFGKLLRQTNLSVEKQAFCIPFFGARIVLFAHRNHA